MKRRMRIPINSRHSATSVFFALLLVGSVPGDAIAQTSPLWRYEASDSIAFFRVTPLGSVLVATDVSLTSVDGVTGAPMWVCADKDLDETNVVLMPASPLALVTWRTGFDAEVLSKVRQRDSYPRGIVLTSSILRGPWAGL